jgi:hypothetical protein
MRAASSGTILPPFAECSKIASTLRTVNQEADMPANHDEVVLQRIFELVDAGKLGGKPDDFADLNLSMNELVESLQRLDRLGIFSTLHARKSSRDESGYIIFAFAINLEELKIIRSRFENE